MRDVFVVSDNIFSPLGTSTDENIANLKLRKSAICRHEDPAVSEEPFYASLFSKDIFAKHTQPFTRFELLVISSIEQALKNAAVDPASEKTLLIISTTKGNISMLESAAATQERNKRISLHASAKLIAGHFNFKNDPLLVSNACISGILATLTAMRLIRSGKYDHAAVVGADVISKFILSGFQSFQAVSDGPCKPFDASRNGINLGEGAATLVLSANKDLSNGTRIAGGSMSNDANHISGPSRSGEELYMAISKALDDARLTSAEIDFISAHGTATIYNDEMEAKAINLAKMQGVPVNSLKGFYGHTLGAAGLIESVVAIASLKNNMIFPSLGFDKMGVTEPINVATEFREMPLRNVLKTASGFGGCNAAMVISKHS